MKNFIIKGVASMALLSIAFTSCDLDVMPPADLADVSFWKTEKHAWYNMNTIYAGMPDYSSGMIDELYTDNAHSHKSWEGPFESFQNGGITSAEASGYSYQQIRKTNTFIAKVGGCEMDAKLRERMIAEAKFFRAMSYLDMVIKFGRVPLVTEPLEYDAPTVARTELATIQAFILKELADIALILPDSYNGGESNETGRVTRAAALTLRARAALYFGNYTESEKSATAVITEGHHSLYKVTTLNEAQQRESDEMDQFVDFAALGINKDKFIKGMFSYGGIWIGDNGTPKNPEAILVRERMNNANSVDWARYQYSRPSQLVKGYSSYEPMPDLVAAYWNIDGKTRSPYQNDESSLALNNTNYTQIYQEVADLDQKGYIAKVPTMNLKSYEYIKQFRNRDSRLYASILFPFKGWHETDFQGPFYYLWRPEWPVQPNGNESWSSFSFRKLIATRPYDTGAGENYSYDDFPVLRYAEVLLTAAEAHVQTTGYDAVVQGYLNQLRDRCGMPDVPTSFASKQEALDFIWNERRIELAGEGQRFADMRRYGKEYCKNAMTGGSYAPSKYLIVNKQWNDRNMLFPIPQDAIDVNPLLKDDQNPGYN